MCEDRNRLIDLENEFMVAGGEGTVKDFGMDRYTLLYLKWITNKDLLYVQGTLLNVMWQSGRKGSFGGKWIHAYVRLNIFIVHLKLSQHCLLIDYTPI